jgi:hypothetical protein
MRDIAALRFAAHEAPPKSRAGPGGNHQPGLAAYSHRNPGLTPFPALPRLPEYAFREDIYGLAAKQVREEFHDQHS